MTASPRDKQCAIAVMAKAPREGAVKTRLVPPLSFAQAAELSRGFLRDITENIRLAARRAPIAGFVAFAPAGVEALFEGVLAPGTGLLLADGALEAEPEVEGFGRCLLQTLRDLLSMGYGSAIVLNSDSPTLPTALLCAAAESLARPECGIVLGPAEDGGYYLLGTRRADAHLFKKIAWSTDQVAEQTRQRAAERGLAVRELPSWYDVDDRQGLSQLIGDLGRVDPMLSLAPFAAPATAATLRNLGLLTAAGVTS